jgi:hypothetical protein
MSFSDRHGYQHPTQAAAKQADALYQLASATQNQSETSEKLLAAQGRAAAAALEAQQRAIELQEDHHRKVEKIQEEQLALSRQEAEEKATERAFQRDVEWLKNSDQVGRLEFLVERHSDELEALLPGSILGAIRGKEGFAAAFSQYDRAKTAVDVAQAELTGLSEKKDSTIQARKSVANPKKESALVRGCGIPIAVLGAFGLVFSYGGAVAAYITLAIIIFSLVYLARKRATKQKRREEELDKEIKAFETEIGDRTEKLAELQSPYQIQAQTVAQIIDKELISITNFTDPSLIRPSFQAALSSVQKKYPSAVRCNLADVADSDFRATCEASILSAVTQLRSGVA